MTRPWPVRWAIALVLAVTAVDVFAGRLVRATPAWGLSPIALSLSLLAVFGVLYAIVFAIVWLGAHGLRDTFTGSVAMRRIPRPGAWIGIAAAAAVGLRLFATAYAGFMLSMRWRLWGWDTNPTKYFPHDLLGGVVLVLVVCVAAPIAEESVFRGVLLPSLVGRMGERWGIAITSVVFAALHLNAFSFLPILVVAWVLAMLFLRSQSLWVSIVCHSLFNAIGVLGVLLLRGNGVV